MEYPRPDNTGGRPQILTEASKSLMKRVIDLERLKSGVEIFDYLKDIYPRLAYNTAINALKSQGFIARPKIDTSFVSKTQESALGLGTCS
jgi:hypothetical protein